MYNFRASVVMPVYNSQKFIRSSLMSLINQDMNKSDFEIIIVDNNSTDKSVEICKDIISENTSVNIRLFHELNKGVSFARNTGILQASGKYIFFLDSDDELSLNCLSEVCSFFDTVYNQVDLVTYKIDTIYNKRKMPDHFRYRYLKNSGVYDLREYSYIGQTTMNIVIKNDKKIFFDTSMNFGEDQKFCCDILSDKLKLGFCDRCSYIYNRHSESSSSSLSGSCYIFEESMGFFEDLFKKFKNTSVPSAFQALYIHDLDWKLNSGILFPYHYNRTDYENALKRIDKLIDRCDIKVILNHPAIDYMQKLYWISRKHFKWKKLICNENHISLIMDYNLVFRSNSFDIVISKIYGINNRIFIRGYIKSPVFLWFNENISLYIRINNEYDIKAELFSSDFSYSLKGEKTQNFQGFSYEADCSNIKSIAFFVKADDYMFTPLLNFDVMTGIDRMTGRFECIKGNIKVLADSNKLKFNLVNSEKSEIWIYYDCKTVQKDNGMFQFIHDISINDGIKRYYIITSEKQSYYLKNLKISAKNTIYFGSAKHKKILEKCSKIITAFIEPDNLFPYPVQDYHKYSGKWKFETVYLQHGVMHINMPWKYSAERLLADRIVISTYMEKKAFKFREKDTIEAFMPRMNLIERNTVPDNRIIAAPSWREYLISYDAHGNIIPVRNKFAASKFFIKWNDILNSTELENLLEKYDMYLDFKLHPIFNFYKDMFSVKNSRINIGSELPSYKYSIMITDFSSYVYDFVYLNRCIMYFIPDNEEFKCGMNSYREVLSESENFGCCAYEKSEFIKNLSVCLENNCVPEKKYLESMKKCFLTENTNSCDKIYNEIKNIRL